MAELYQDLLARAFATYQGAGNGFHPEGVAAGIAAAVDEFKAPLTSAAAAIAKQASGRYPDPQAYAADAQGARRSLDFQRGVLQAALSRAARADQVRINGAAALDRAAMAHRAKVQQGADDALAARIDKLVRRVGADLAAAARAVKPAPRPARRAAKKQAGRKAAHAKKVKKKVPRRKR